MKTHPRNSLGRALQLARSAKGVSQEDFSAVSGRTYISEIERGLRNTTLNKVEELAEVLGMHPATLVALSYIVHQTDDDAIEALLDQIRSELITVTGRIQV